MSILENYKKISADKEIFDQYYKCGKKHYGNMFLFKNTNYRYIDSIITNYNTFKVIDGIDRTEWEVAKHGQEKLKQHTVNMLQMKLFSKNERTYYKTEKGLIMEEISENTQKFTEEEIWILVCFLIFDSYFNNQTNYIFQRSKYIFENLIASGIDETEIMNAITQLLSSKLQRKRELSEKDYLYMDTFFMPLKEKNFDFISEYNLASKTEKEELYQYVGDNIEKGNSNCIISKKFEKGGNYDKKMLIENAKILYIAISMNKLSNLSFGEFVYKLIDCYEKIERINKGKLIKFIFDHREVFEIIYFNIFNIDYLGLDSTEDSETTEDFKEEKIDDTSTKNIEKLKRMSSILKKKAKERTNYKCELEELCNCNYFTSKETQKNYLEIHHFIPREFGNEFEKSIEIIDNYIALCPRCHRMIHLAVDRERKVLINSIYNKRIERLKSKGLEVTLKEVEEFYNIEN